MSTVLVYKALAYATLGCNTILVQYLNLNAVVKGIFFAICIHHYEQAYFMDSPHQVLWQAAGGAIP